MLWVLCPHSSGPPVTCSTSPGHERSPLFPRASPDKEGTQVSGVLSTGMEGIVEKYTPLALTTRSLGGNLFRGEALFLVIFLPVLVPTSPS